MNQQEVRRFVERYLESFSSHIHESHPAYLTVKLPVEVDKDIGNRPFYWSWVERMNIPPQPMILTFIFDAENAPEGLRGEPLHFGSGRLQQIFQSTRRHGRFVCLYESVSLPQRPPARRSAALTPWLCLNLNVSFVCDKKRDMLLSLGINLYQPRIVHNFYPFLQRLTLVPAIPNYVYTLEGRLTLEAAADLAEQEARRVIAREDATWAERARERLAEELDILEAYYRDLPPSDQQVEPEAQNDPPSEADSEDAVGAAIPAEPGEPAGPLRAQGESAKPEPAPAPSGQPPASPLPPEQAQSGGRILDFLRMNGIPETPKEEQPLAEWKASTPEEEKARRIAELKWQYEPRIEISFVNGGLFYLFNQPPFGEAMPHPYKTM